MVLSRFRPTPSTSQPERKARKIGDEPMSLSSFTLPVAELMRGAEPLLPRKANPPLQASF